MEKPLALGVGEEAAIALVADQALVALLQLPLQRGDDVGAVGGVLLHLIEVAADDVAPPRQRHRLGLVVDIAPRLHENERNGRRGIVEHEFAHELVGSLAHAQNVEQPSRFEFGDGLGADHAAVGDDADAVDAKAPLQAIDRRDQALHVGGVAGPHLRAYRPAVAVEEHGQDHLVEVGPMVLGEAAPPERLDRPRPRNRGSSYP